MIFFHRMPLIKRHEIKIIRAQSIQTTSGIMEKNRRNFWKLMDLWWFANISSPKIRSSNCHLIEMQRSPTCPLCHNVFGTKGKFWVSCFLITSRDSARMTRFYEKCYWINIYMDRPYFSFPFWDINTEYYI